MTRPSLPFFIFKKAYKKMAKKVLFSFLCLLYISSAVSAINIIINGSWIIDIDATDLQSGPGSDLISTYESSPSQIKVHIKKTQARQWEVDVKKADLNWPSQFHLFIRRTSDGVPDSPGHGWISGGTSYLEIMDSDRAFFWGEKNRNNITFQLKVDGVSTQILVGVYITYVYYTAIETF